MFKRYSGTFRQLIEREESNIQVSVTNKIFYYTNDNVKTVNVQTEGIANCTGCKNSIRTK